MDLRAIRIALADRCQGMDVHVYDVQPQDPQWPAVIISGALDEITYSSTSPAAEQNVTMIVSLVHGGDIEEAQRSIDLLASTGNPESVPDRYITQPRKQVGEPWGYILLRRGTAPFRAEYGDGAQRVVQVDLYVEVHAASC